MSFRCIISRVYLTPVLLCLGVSINTHKDLSSTLVLQKGSLATWHGADHTMYNSEGEEEEEEGERERGRDFQRPNRQPVNPSTRQPVPLPKTSTRSVNVAFGAFSPSSLALRDAPGRMKRPFGPSSKGARREENEARVMMALSPSESLWLCTTTVHARRRETFALFSWASLFTCHGVHEHVTIVPAGLLQAADERDGTGCLRGQRSCC
jgi:hypothetical protein